MAKPIPPEIRRQVIERDMACVYCGRPVNIVVKDNVPVTQRWRALDERGATFHFDHRIPLAAGGETTVDNLCLACPECNLIKARSHDKRMAHRGRGPATRHIKLADDVYAELTALKGKGETYSDVLNNLLDARLKIFELLSVLEGQVNFREWQNAELKKLRNSHGRGDRPEVPNMQTGEMGTRPARLLEESL